MTHSPMMANVILVMLASVLLLGVAMSIAQTTYGLDGYRFGTKPSSYTKEVVQKLASEPKAAAGYVMPVLFPIDLMFLAAYGALLCVWSLYFAENAGISPYYVWLTLLLPVLYMASDLSENILLTRMMTDPAGITDRMVDLTKWVTRIKIVLFFAGLLQGLVITGLACWPGSRAA